MIDRDWYIQDRMKELADLGLSTSECKRVAEAEYNRMVKLADLALSARERKCAAETDYERKNRSRTHEDREADKLYEDLLLEQQEQM